MDYISFGLLCFSLALVVLSQLGEKNWLALTLLTADLEPTWTAVSARWRSNSSEDVIVLSDEIENSKKLF